MLLIQGETVKRILALLLVSFSSQYIHTIEPSKAEKVQRISSTEIANHSQYWVNQIPELSSEEYHLLANLLYFECLTKYYESVSRSMLNAIYIQLINMNKLLAKNEANSKKVALDTSEKLQQLYDELLPLRSYCGKSMKACAEEIEKSGHKTLKEIIGQLQQYGQAIIVQCINQDQEAITKLIKNGKTVCEERIETLHSCKKIYDGILENDNPYLKEGSNPIIGNIETSVSAADNMLVHMQDITQAMIGIRNISSDILNVHVLIMRTFYNALIELLAKKQFEPIQIMFDENGLITKENRDENLVALDSNFSIHKKHYTAQ